MASPNHFELQQQNSLTNSLLDDSRLSNSSILINSEQNSIRSNKNVKNLNSAKMKMEHQAEQQVINSHTDTIKQIIKTYEDGLIQIKKKKMLINYLPVITPQKIIIWKLFIALVILFIFFEIPVYIMYGQQFWDALASKESQFLLFYSLAFCLIVDMFLNFITAYYKHGNLVTDSTKIARHYFYGFFIFDCTALLFSIIRFSLYTDKYRFIYLIFYFKLPSLLRIDKQIGEIILLLKQFRLLFQVFKMIIFMLFCFNVFSCVFYKIGTYAVSANMNSWLNTPGNFGTIMDLPIHEIYFFGYYYALGTVSTTMGYGDITPMNIYECSWALTGIMFAVMVFALNINNFQLLMEEYNSYEMKRFRLKVGINKFMEQKNVPSEMQERVRQYLNEYWYEQGTRDKELENEIFQILAPELKTELIYCSFGSFLQTTLFAQHFSQLFLKELSSKVQEVSYSTGDYIIIDQGNDQMDDQCFYFVISGQISMTPGNSNLIQKKLHSGEYFGEWSFFTGFPRTATAQAKVYSQLYKIKRSDFLEVLGRFPDDYERYCQIRDNLLFSKNIGYLGQNCWTCKGVDHYAFECPLTHYKPPAQNLIENNTVIDLKQNRMKIERYKRKQWPTRVNSHILIKGLNKSKLKKQVTQMLKTQRALKGFQSPLKQQQVSPQQQKISINVIRAESIEGSDQLLNQSLSPNKLKANSPIESIDQSISLVKEPQNRLEEYKKISQPYIHKGLDKFDMPANFKHYYKKFNSNKFTVFKGMETAEQQQRIIDPRKSFLSKKQ